MKNKLANLNDYLFEEIERVMDCANNSQSREKLNAELQRAKTMTGLSNTIINNAKTQLQAIEIAYTCNIKKEELPEVVQKKTNLLEVIQ